MANEKKVTKKTVSKTATPSKKAETTKIVNEVKKAEDKVEEVTKVEEKKVEPKKEEVKKAETKKAEPKKEAAKKSTPKKTTATKTTATKTTATKTTTEKKTARKTTSKVVTKSVFVEYYGQQTRIDVAHYEERVKDIWLNDWNRLAKDLKEIDLYIKPEDGKVYFVVNGTEHGDIIL